MFNLEFAECVDLGDAPEIFITGISKIEQIGPGTIRFTFYSERDNCRRVVLHSVWDLKRWEQDSSSIEDARGALRYGPNRDHTRAS